MLELGSPSLARDDALRSTVSPQRHRRPQDLPPDHRVPQLRARCSPGWPSCPPAPAGSAASNARWSAFVSGLACASAAAIRRATIRSASSSWSTSTRALPLGLALQALHLRSHLQRPALLDLLGRRQAASGGPARPGPGLCSSVRPSSRSSASSWLPSRWVASAPVTGGSGLAARRARAAGRAASCRARRRAAAGGSLRRLAPRLADRVEHQPHEPDDSSAGPKSTAQLPVVGALSPPPAIAVRMVVSAWMFR